MLQEVFLQSFGIIPKYKPRAMNQAEAGKKYVVILMVLDLKVFTQLDQVSSEKRDRIFCLL